MRGKRRDRSDTLAARYHCPEAALHASIGAGHVRRKPTPASGDAIRSRPVPLEPTRSPPPRERRRPLGIDHAPAGVGVRAYAGSPEGRRRARPDDGVADGLTRRRRVDRGSSQRRFYAPSSSEHRDRSMVYGRRDTPLNLHVVSACRDE